MAVLNFGWALQLFKVGSLGAQDVLVGCHGFVVAGFFIAWSRVLLTPHEKYGELILAASAGTIVAFFGYLAFLLGGVGAVSGATVSAFLAALTAVGLSRLFHSASFGAVLGFIGGLLVGVPLLIPASIFFSYFWIFIRDAVKMA